MAVWEYILEKLQSQNKMHMTLLDPDKQPPDVAAEMAAASEQAGTDAIMVGGSTALDQEDLDKTVSCIKGATKIPVILFPTTAKCLSSQADAIYFMSMLNSKNLKYVVGEQKIGAPIIKQIGLEPIPMGYVIVEPGMKVGEIGEAEPLPRNAVEDAKAFALLAEFFGMKLVYFEAGSGAPEPVPVEMVRAVKSAVNIPVIVGGGIRSKESALALAEAGADVVVTGTLVEETGDIKPTLEALISAVKGVTKSDANE